MGKYLDSLVIIHDPMTLIVTIGEAMIMLPIVAHLKLRDHEERNKVQISITTTNDPVRHSEHKHK